ncbi:MFS transporter [Anaeromyxobacter diazotrophicus]|uniref:Permease n=1 Tax=Anaeromyxobacter diazotrophicus TaxID=2590199 RepID=A0A7I9VMZ4_9BACT|nr:MFS transporter [Anaeromyxobacter diazotrophicus]GEJ57774.1 permease [Anaeromyxobacter diazotrophicus]
MSADAPARPTRLFNKNFVLLWQGQLVSALGNHAFVLATSWWVKEATGSATLLGLYLVLSSVPSLLLEPIGGTYADRHSRRNVLITTDALSGVALLLAGTWMYVARPGATAGFIGLAVLTVLLDAASAFFNPAISAAIPDLVPRQRIGGANSAIEVVAQLSTFAGQGLGGILFTAVGAPIMLLIDGVSFLFSAGTEAFIQIPQRLPARRTNGRRAALEFLAELGRGFRYIWAARGLRSLVLASAALNFFAVPIIVLMPFFVEDTLGADARWYGFIAAAYGVGSLAGSVAAGIGRPSGGARRARMLALFALQAGTCLALALVRHPLPALAVAALGGAFGGALTIYVVTIVQVTTPEDMRGRVFGLLGTIAGSISPIAMMLAGLAADWTGRKVPAIYAGCGAAMLVVAAVAASRRTFRTFIALDLTEPTPEAPAGSGRALAAPEVVP